MSSIFTEDACALASKLESKYDSLIQPSATDKAVIVLYRAFLESLREIDDIKQNQFPARIEKLTNDVRNKAMRDAIEAVDAAGGDNEDYHIEAIKRKFGLEI